MPVGIFAFLAVLAVITGLGVILQRNPVHCVLALALVLTDLGVIFMGLGAVTVGFLQIIVYVGAIMVLFLFVIWLLNIQVDPGAGGHLGLKLLGAVAAAAMAGEFAEVIEHTPKISQIATVPADFGSVAELARYLFTDYLVAFEVTSVLLLAAVVGAIALARRVSPSLVLVAPVAARGATSPPEPDVPVARRESA
ncbi:MAG TPA: NADH-quinone oxidoreductase subunit J [Candidatus Binataceae bacterium]|jgi:NADH-quinone oxidoreductase subunit J